MESFESWHDAEEWGPLSSEDGELVSVPDLVRLQMLTPLPLPPRQNTCRLDRARLLLTFGS